MAETLSKVYEPEKVEKKWYDYWEKSKFFHAEIDWDKEPFTIVIPPPNVTGSLHIGHALNNSLQDIIIRWKRMQQVPTLWLPGTDHAGIATQNVVETELAKEGISRHDLGREKFIERVWEWKAQYGSRIIEQLKSLGASCDWDRERFTFDEGLSKAVRTVFVRLYNEGLIYRGHYIINWCPRCLTALSDIEVEHQETEGRLWHIKYFLKESDGEGAEQEGIGREGPSDYVTVATTRPETLLGDTALAVHPDDKRYEKYVGRTALLPMLGRELSIVADSFVDPEFGTGVVKVTPAHDPNDFDIGKRHDLPQINILTEEAVVNENGGPYAGMDRYEAREKLVADLEAKGEIVKIEDHEHSVGHCYRCDTVVEPYLSDQWFVKMKPLAEPATEAVETKRTEFIPEMWTRTYFDWMGNVRDWCISRQIWWGHQIPAWYCESEGCGEVAVDFEAPDECPKCGGSLRQDPDVLDTWFSSALWPFSTLGWPDETDDVKYFYPTSLLVTSHDIIYFWVARMMIMGLHFMGDVPFDEVYIHALVRDVYGKKMSKSRGNVIDPLDMTCKYGTDAVRFTLAALSVPGRDVYLSEERIEGYRNFANKIWNASRFVLMNLEGYEGPEGHSGPRADEGSGEALAEMPGNFTLADRWILSRLNRLIGEVDEALGRYHFSQASRRLYDFFWSEFADWYIELSKPRLYQPKDPAERATAQHVLLTVLDAVLKLLHPFIPFITEEIWQQLPTACRTDSGGGDGGGETGAGKKTIVLAHWPVADGTLIDERVEMEMETIQAVTTAVRSIRSQLSIPPQTQLTAFVASDDPGRLTTVRKDSDYILSLANLAELVVDSAAKPPKRSAIDVEAGMEVHVPVEGLVDLEAEVARLQKETGVVSGEIKKAQAKLGNKQFTDKAPPPVVEKERAKLATLEDKFAKLDRQIKQLR